MFSQTILSKIQNTSFLITGGAGFIGSNLIEKLIELKAEKIVILDDLSTGFVENISSFLDLEQVTFIEGSITNQEICSKAMKGIDIVFHLAALGSVPRSIDNPIATNNVNIDGFVNVLWAAREHKIKKLVYSSSSSVYGDDQTIPKIETNLGKPLSPYAVTKRTNELYANTFSDIYDMPIVGLRYFNVFGPKQNIKGAYAAVIPIFIGQLLNNKPCYINGDGEISRDFTYVDNVVYANILAAMNHNASDHDIFNIAMGEQLSLNGLYQNIENTIQSGLTAIHQEKRLGDIQNSLANINKAVNILDYNPIVSVKDGLEKTIAWYRNNL